jgi:hypothetical protein
LEIIMPSLKSMNVEALMKLREQVDERLLAVAFGVAGAIARAIIGYLLHWLMMGLDPSGETWAGGRSGWWLR